VLTKGDQYRAPMRQIEQDAKKSLEDRRTLMLDRCFVAKSKGVPPSAIQSVHEIGYCGAIHNSELKRDIYEKVHPHHDFTNFIYF
jgi:hypothetical protein